MERDAAGRPHLGPLLGELVRALVASAPEVLGHIDAEGLLFVAAAARRSARASIRPLRFRGGRNSPNGRFEKPELRRNGQLLRYEIALRPAWFLLSTPFERLRTVIHELWHIDPRFDGTLAEERRHDRQRIEAPVIEELARAFRGDTAALALSGEVRLEAWLDRPPSMIPIGMSARRHYDERDLFLAVLEQKA